MIVDQLVLLARATVVLKICNRSMLAPDGTKCAVHGARIVARKQQNYLVGRLHDGSTGPRVSFGRGTQVLEAYVPESVTA